MGLDKQRCYYCPLPTYIYKRKQGSKVYTYDLDAGRAIVVWIINAFLTVIDPKCRSY